MTETTQRVQAGGRSRVRSAASNIILHIHPVRVPAPALRFSYTWALGGTATLLVLTLVSTGVLLMFRYEPTVDRAYLSIQSLETEVMFGSLVRAVHHWSANLLIVVAFLHLLRVFFTGAYKQGRSLNWVVGLGLFALVLVFAFTGYLLPWDQLAYWAVTVGMSLVDYVPLIGGELSLMLLGGPEIGQAALSNFYALHVAVLPVLMVSLLSYHFWRIRKDGGISRPQGQREERVPTIPNLVQRELAFAAAVLAAITVWAMLVPAPLEAVANPSESPNPAKAAWYFLGLQELLLHMHTLALLALMAIVVGGLALLPRWDAEEGSIGIYFRSRLGRRAALAGGLSSLYVVPLLVLLDEYWLDLTGWLPGLPALVSNGLLPLLLTLAGLAAIYGLLRRALHASHGEALVGLFSFIMASLVVLTLIGIYFRGPNMGLVLPF
jgi:quinol-cytochrome oxidoreductase complex cytochrome b subunit